MEQANSGWRIKLGVFGCIVALCCLTAGAARAACTCLPDVLTLRGVTIGNPANNGSSVCDCLKNTVVGESNDFRSILPWKDKEQFPDKNVRSLVDYFEKIWWVRWNTAQQRIFRDQSDMNAVNNSLVGRLFEALKIANYASGVEHRDLDARWNFADVDEVACDVPSMQQSASMARMLTLQDLGRLSNRFATESAGRKTTTGYGHDALERDQAAVKQTLAWHTFDPGGNAGANRMLADGKGWNPKLTNAHIDVETLLHQPTLEDEGVSATPRIQYDRRLAEMFVTRLFPHRAYTALGSSSLKDLPLEAAQILSERDSLNAQQSVLARPALKMLAERSAQAKDSGSIASFSSLLAALQLAGIRDPNVLAKFQINGRMSEAAMDEIRYKIYMENPDNIIKNATWDAANIARFMSILAMQQISLLYDIREELKQLALVSGTTGSMLSADAFKEIEAKTMNVPTPMN